jgi:hypothetical protein
MDEIIAYLLKRPMLCAALSVLALVDMANCIRLEHMDWPIPAIAAFSMACLVQRTNA